MEIFVLDLCDSKQNWFVWHIDLFSFRFFYRMRSFFHIIGIAKFRDGRENCGSLNGSNISAAVHLEICTNSKSKNRTHEIIRNLLCDLRKVEMEKWKNK